MNFPGNDDDLIKRLVLQTEIKSEKIQVGTDDNYQEQETVFQTEDFEPEPKPFLNEPDPGSREHEAVKLEPEIKKPLSYYENEARGIVGFIDGISTIFLPGIYKKRLIGTENLKRGEELEQAIRDGKQNELSEDDRVLMQLFVEVEKLIKEIPFKPEEKEMIIGPMSEVMQKYATTIGPEWRLAFAVGAVSFPRLIPLWRGV